MLKEWSLVVFTIAGQMAVGVLLLFNVPFLLYSRLPSAGWRMIWLASLALVVALLALAALVSFCHLRHPFRARRALSNLRTSWLSREILFEVAVIVLVAMAAILGWSRPGESGIIKGVLTAACLAGGLFLVSMAKLYMLPTLPVWSDLYTPLSFFLTAIILGAMATEAVIRARGTSNVFPLPLMTISFVLISVEILLAVFIAPRHGIFGSRPAPSLRPNGTSPWFLHWGRLVLLTGGLVLIVIAGWGEASNDLAAGRPSLVVLLAFVSVLAGEVAGRFLFYGLNARPGR